MPEDFDFEGYTPDVLPIDPASRKFEKWGDVVGYSLAYLSIKATHLFRKLAPFRYHSESAPFIYDMPQKDARLAVLADFGNGLPHARYIARHIRRMHPDHLLYLGDVYYSGTSTEYARYVRSEVDPLLDTTNVMMLTSNHEMYAKLYPYFDYLDERLARGLPQCQQGSYFCLRFGEAFQFIGIETDYFGYRRYTDTKCRQWLGDVLRAGREMGAVNVLLSANEPFTIGERDFSPLYEDLRPFLGAVDMWLWGNTHYCAVFGPSGEMPLSVCLGHGGYPYHLSQYGLDEPDPSSPLPVHFVETAPRYYGTPLRPELGNNGFVELQLDSAHRSIDLRCIDWRNRLRYRATVERGRDRVDIANGESFATC